MKTWTTEDGGFIKDSGTPYRKKPSIVYLFQLEEQCEVETNEGVLIGNIGDYLAYDEFSGHVWPIHADYVEHHYDRVVDW